MFGNISGNLNLIFMEGTSLNMINKILFYTFPFFFFFVDWEDLLKNYELNAANSTKIYLDKINMLLDTYVPLKKLINKI